MGRTRKTRTRALRAAIKSSVLATQQYRRQRCLVLGLHILKLSVVHVHKLPLVLCRCTISTLASVPYLML